MNDRRSSSQKLNPWKTKNLPAHFVEKKDDTNLLIAGLDAHICDRCIEQASGIILEESTHKVVEANRDDISLVNPKQIKLFLDDYVIGQDYTKGNVCGCLQPLQTFASSKSEVEIQKSML